MNTNPAIKIPITEKTEVMKSIKDIVLTPKPGKKYWKNCQREWREEFIYFMLVDRFHDSNNRNVIVFSGRHTGFGDERQLQQQKTAIFFG